MPNLPTLQSALRPIPDPSRLRPAVIATVVLLLGLLLWQLQLDFSARLGAREQQSVQQAEQIKRTLENDLQLRIRVAGARIAEISPETAAAQLDDLQITFPALRGLQPLPTLKSTALARPYSLVGDELQLHLHLDQAVPPDWLLRFELEALQQLTANRDAGQSQWLLEDTRSTRLLLPQPEPGAAPRLLTMTAQQRELSVAQLPVQLTDWQLHALFDRAEAIQQVLWDMAGKLLVFLLCALSAGFGLLLLQRQLRITSDLNHQIRRTLRNGGSILDTIEERVLVSSSNGQIRYANPQAAHLLGGDGNSPVGRLLQELLPELAPVIRGERPVKDGEPSLLTISEDGVPRVFSVTRSPLKDIEQPGDAWVLRDVTEEQQALQHLQQARRRYQDIFEGSSLALCVLDCSPLLAFLARESIGDEAGLRDWLYANPNRHAELIGTVVFREANPVALRLFQTDDLKKVEALLLRGLPMQPDGLRFNLIRAVLDGRLLETEARITLGGGDSRHIALALNLPDATQDYNAVALSITDITVRKQAQLTLADREQFWSQILSSMPDNLYVMDVKQRSVLFSNHHIGKQLGYSTEQLQQLGRDFWNRLEHPDDSDYSGRLKNLQQVIPEGRTLEFLARWRHSNGSWRWFSVREQALNRDSAGRVERLVGIAKDVTEQIQASDSLRESERRHRLLAESISDVIYTTNTRLKINYVSSSSISVLGYSADWLMAEDVRKLAANRSQLKAIGEIFQLIRRHSRDPERLHALDQQISDQVFIFDCLRADDRVIPIEVRLTLMWDDQGRFEGMLGVVRDITQQRRAEKDLRMAATVFEHSTAAIAVTDPAGYLVQVNEAFVRVTGYPSDEVLDQLPIMLAADAQQANQLSYILKLLYQNNSWEGEIWLKRRNGDPYPAWVGITAVKDLDGALVSYVCFFSDISERKASEQRIHRLAYYDPLTQLPNRTLFQDRLHTNLQQAERDGEWLALMFLDLDRFKPINDSLGHAAGDRMLKEVALRLTECVDSEDTVARMGGDEFTLLLSARQSRDAALNRAIRIGEQILASLATPFVLQGREFFVTASIGIALSPQDGSELSQLMKNADTAMYHAKARGKNNFQFYQAEMNARALERLELESDLRHALEQGQSHSITSRSSPAATCA